jgi:hypothetical protein
MIRLSGPVVRPNGRRGRRHSASEHAQDGFKPFVVGLCGAAGLAVVSLGLILFAGLM